MDEDLDLEVSVLGVSHEHEFAFHSCAATLIDTFCSTEAWHGMDRWVIQGWMTRTSIMIHGVSLKASKMNLYISVVGIVAFVTSTASKSPVKSPIRSLIMEELLPLLSNLKGNTG